MERQQKDRLLTEKATLKTFRSHRPSEYFSHLDYVESFERHHDKIEELYRFGLNFPPEMFAGRKVLDLGCGTGENTISLAKWGAKCTLVELNPDAIQRAKEVFKHLAPDADCRFINKSVFDLSEDDFAPETFDVVHSRGVFMHVADKGKAFEILVRAAKVGGFIIYGDRNTAGGVQEMLQRMAIFSLAGGNTEKISEVAESLFKEDIDRSQAALPRTREAIIFDRWVIQQQDDPPIAEVMQMFKEQGLRLYSTWPSAVQLAVGDSTVSKRPSLTGDEGFVTLTEAIWMIQNTGYSENVKSIEGSELSQFSSSLFHFSDMLRNLQIGDKPDYCELAETVREMSRVAEGAFDFANFHGRLRQFFLEVLRWVELVESKSKVEDFLLAKQEFSILFKGLAGVRHVDYIGYKER
jgi:SAM-dependent methyltransferase